MDGIGTYHKREIALHQAQFLANTANETCYVIGLAKGWTIYYASDPAFEKHQPATYAIIEPAAKRLSIRSSASTW